MVLQEDIKDLTLLKDEVYHINAVPANLIRKSIPAYEERINAILYLLSDGKMKLRIITEKENKTNNKTRDVFEYEINDGTGWDKLEAFSGGEVTRINFAIRLGLNQLSADIQGLTNDILIIDESISQLDASGKEEFAAMLSKLETYFKRIFIITHDTEFKEMLDHITKFRFKKTSKGSKVNTRR
jgi:exonuclease SbcC